MSQLTISQCKCVCMRVSYCIWLLVRVIHLFCLFICSLLCRFVPYISMWFNIFVAHLSPANWASEREIYVHIYYSFPLGSHVYCIHYCRLISLSIPRTITSILFPSLVSNSTLSWGDFDRHNSEVIILSCCPPACGPLLLDCLPRHYDVCLFCLQAKCSSRRSRATSIECMRSRHDNLCAPANTHTHIQTEHRRTKPRVTKTALTVRLTVPPFVHWLTICASFCCWCCLLLVLLYVRILNIVHDLCQWWIRDSALRRIIVLIAPLSLVRIHAHTRRNDECCRYLLLLPFIVIFTDINVRALYSSIYFCFGFFFRDSFLYSGVKQPTVVSCMKQIWTERIYYIYDKTNGVIGWIGCWKYL